MTALLALLGLAAGLALWYGPFVVVRWNARRSLRRRARGWLLLTYDDGPGRALQSRLLPLLREHGARAVFFVLGEKAERAPELCQELQDAGHTLASHGYAHLDAWRTSPWREVANIRSGLRSLARWQTLPLYRPPYGKASTLGWLYMLANRVRLCLWTVDSGDTQRETPDPQAVVARVVRDRGGVVLLHSFDRRPGEEAREDFVLEVTRRLLEAARAISLELASTALLCDG